MLIHPFLKKKSVLFRNAPKAVSYMVETGFTEGTPAVKEHSMTHCRSIFKSDSAPLSGEITEVPLP
jgi:hypothetical protein